MEIVWMSGHMKHFQTTAALNFRYCRSTITVPVKTKITKIAIGAAITSKHIEMFRPATIRYLPLFSLLESFCETASLGYEYHFYFGYDWDDKIAQAPFLTAISNEFRIIMQRCGDLHIGGLLMIKCHYSGKPAWAQNDVMMQAYVDNMDYFYRVNDDTILLTMNWSAIFIETLEKFNPPYVGVVGPTITKHRKLTGPPDRSVLTHDFVHRTHIAIFGFYYPRLFTTWFADNWISYVYTPRNRVMLSDVLANNSEIFGVRYNVDNRYMLNDTKQTADLHKRVLHR
jgi:hypothetical protein